MKRRHKMAGETERIAKALLGHSQCRGCLAWKPTKTMTRYDPEMMLCVACEDTMFWLAFYQKPEEQDYTEYVQKFFGKRVGIFMISGMATVRPARTPK